MVSNDLINDLAKAFSIKANQTLSLQTEEPTLVAIKDLEDKWAVANSTYSEKKDVPADHIKYGNELSWVSSYLKANKIQGMGRIDTFIQGAVIQEALAEPDGFLISAYNQLNKELYV